MLKIFLPNNECCVGLEAVDLSQFPSVLRCKYVERPANSVFVGWRLYIL